MRICKEIEIDYNVCLCIHYIIRAKVMQQNQKRKIHVELFENMNTELMFTVLYRELYLTVKLLLFKF